MSAHRAAHEHVLVEDNAYTERMQEFQHVKAGDRRLTTCIRQVFVLMQRIIRVYIM
jgi:hypothetical protein